MITEVKQPWPCAARVSPVGPVRADPLTSSATRPGVGTQCSNPAATVDLVNGFRCLDHPPRWDQSYAQRLHAMGWHHTADTYRHTMMELLKDRILTRYTQDEEAA
jgi:hypothetical protein